MRDHMKLGFWMSANLDRRSTPIARSKGLPENLCRRFNWTKGGPRMIARQRQRDDMIYLAAY